MNIVSQTPLPALAAVLPAANAEAATKSEQAASPQSQSASVVSPNTVADASQELAIADVAAMASVRAALQLAVVSQGGLAQLMADLVQAQQTPGVPAPVQAAIVQVLALRSPIDVEPDVADVKDALTKSGLFTEANAAADLETTAAGRQTLPVRTDIKTALLVLREVLTTWLAGDPALAKDATPGPSRPLPNSPAPPSYNGGSPNRVQSGSAPIPAAAIYPAIDPGTAAKSALAVSTMPGAP